MFGSETPASERFAVRRRLGEGGFGVVHEAWDSKMDAAVAIKTLRRVENTALLRFKREFRSLADIIHPNLVRLGELVSIDDTWFFTMELIDGTDILTAVEGPGASRNMEEVLNSPTVGPESLTIDTPVSRQLGPETSEATADDRGETLELPERECLFDEPRLRDAFGQLTEGVNALHAFGLLHRDLKPSNVLVTRDGRVVILDFGLVAHLGREELTGSMHIVGTPAYMSPEQGLGREVGPASDWYSVGVMLYEALTGSPLFRGSLPHILRERQLPVPRARDLIPTVPEDLDVLCHELLQIDPSARPTGSDVARSLKRPLQTAVSNLPAAATAKTRFVGRDRELGVLENALDQVRDGEAATVFISGVSGMGKTALVQCFVDRMRAADPEAVVLRGRCYQRENVPYKALDSLVDELSQHLGQMSTLEAARFMPRDRSALTRLFPVLGGIGEIGPERRREPEIPDAMELRRRAFAALRELLGRLADSTTLVLFIDDLQWGDVDSAALLREITRQPDPPPVLLIVCYRKEEAERSPLLKVLTREREQQKSSWTLELAELAEEEARELALAAIGDDSAAAVARAQQIARESGGSPFFVDELARHRFSPGDGPPEALRLDSVIEARFSGLPDDARRLLEMVAVAGEPLDLEAANRAAELAAKERGAIELLRAGQWVRPCAFEGREAFETFHDRIRETVVSLVPRGQLPSRHLRVAEAWESVGTASSATLVEHYLVAGERIRAADHARRAADQAAAELAFERAARLYEICLEAGEWLPDRRGELIAKLAGSLANAGRGGDAARAYLAAAEAAEEHQRLELRRRAAEQFLISGHIDDGREALQAVLSMVGMALPATPRRSLLGLLLRRLQIAVRGVRFKARDAADVEARLLERIDVCWSVAIGFGMVENIRGAHFQALNLLLALKAGESFRVARALALELPFSAASGVRTQRRTAALMERCRAMVDHQNDPYLNGLFALQVGAVASLEGRFVESSEACANAETILREQCTGVTWELDNAQLYHNHALCMMGHWNALSQRVPAMLEDASARDDLYLTTYLRTRNAHILHLAADDVEHARHEQERSLEGWSQRGFQVQHYWDWYASGEIDLYGGTPKAAWHRLERGWPAFKRSLLTRAQAVFVEAVLLRARVALALASDAAEVEASRYLASAERDARVLEGQAMPSTGAAAALIRAGVAIQRGNRPAAEELLESAVDAYRRSDLSQYAAASAWRLGRLRDGAEGARLVEEARAWFESQGVRNQERMVGMLAPGRWN